MRSSTTLRKIIEATIFQSETRRGKVYDIVHITVIISSVIITMASSVASLQQAYGEVFYGVEWGFTLALSIDYIFRLYSVQNRLRYARGFFGVVDLISVLPTYLSLLIPGAQFLAGVRFLRILRVFRIFNLPNYQYEIQALYEALEASKRRIVVFIFFVLTCVIVLGSLMYTIEGPENGFTSIPLSIYWAIVTLTTVGYGDISPGTPLGQLLSNLIMLLGYSIIVIPTGIVVTVGGRQARKSSTICPNCSVGEHREDAVYCWKCGRSLSAAADHP